MPRIPWFTISIATVLVSLASPQFAAELPTVDREGFKTSVAPLLAKYCADCHGLDDPEGSFSIDALDADLLKGDGLESWRLVDEQLQFNDMPPEEADQPSPAERATLRKWIRQELLKTQLPGVITDQKLLLPQFGNYVDHQALFGERHDHVTPAPPRIWRLRPDIYDTTMPRLAERVSGLANGLNLLDGSDFKDYSAPYFLDEAAATPLLGNAKKIAQRMVAPESKDRIFKDLVREDGPPSEKTVASAIQMAFRKVLARAPTAEEQERFATFYEQAKQTGGYKPAGKALLTAVLMQPEVLYRLELGDGKIDAHGRVRLSQTEIAYALSYALTDTPLDEFASAAQLNQLATSEQVLAVVQRRLEDDSLLQGKNPRVLQFFREYFHYPFANEVFKDKPEGGEHDSRRLVGDLETTIRDVLRADEDVLANLLTTREYYVDAVYKQVKREGVQLLQQHNKRSPYPTAYSLPLDWKWSAHLQPVKFRADERAGVLTHPAWLAAWSGNFENHPVQRGKWVRTHLLGGSVPDVPIGVDARVPEKEHTTFRDRLKMATNAAECWRCHRKMDPLGVVFERYDHYGRYQRLDAGQPVDASGVITRTGVSELDGRKVESPTELMDILAQSEFVEQVFVRHVFRYLMGRNETLGDANTLQDAHQVYQESGGSFKALVASILSSDSFLYRQVK